MKERPAAQIPGRTNTWPVWHTAIQADTTTHRSLTTSCKSPVAGGIENALPARCRQALSSSAGSLASCFLFLASSFARRRSSFARLRSSMTHQTQRHCLHAASNEAEVSSVNS